MHRRRFLQFASVSSVGAVWAQRKCNLASSLISLQSQDHWEVDRFTTVEFSVTTVDSMGQVKQRNTNTARIFTEPLNGIESLKMVAIAPGRFWMGAANTESSTSGYEWPRHPVKVSSFLISQSPITQAQWAAVASMPKVNRNLLPEPSYFQGVNHPVESVSWLDAVEFCDRLSQHTGHHYHLPNEAQWEYACRAGTNTPFHTGETITSQLADYVGTRTYRREAIGNYRQATTPVGHFSPNAFGLYDMHGNVWEWCADNWRCNDRSASGLRTIRGGGWLDAPVSIRSASRSGYLESSLNRTIGFRVATTSL